MRSRPVNSLPSYWHPHVAYLTSRSCVLSSRGNFSRGFGGERSDKMPVQCATGSLAVVLNVCRIHLFFRTYFYFKPNQISAGSYEDASFCCFCAGFGDGPIY